MGHFDFGAGLQKRPDLLLVLVVGNRAARELSLVLDPRIDDEPLYVDALVGQIPVQPPDAGAVAAPELADRLRSPQKSLAPPRIDPITHLDRHRTGFRRH